jgi:hypothetical protein
MTYGALHCGGRRGQGKFGPGLVLQGLLTVSLALMAVPAFAQVDLSGNWVARAHEDWEERGPGPEVVDYLGLPINEEARSRALAYSASALSLPERQCLYYAPHYVVIGPFGLKIWSESDPVTGRILTWKIGGVLDRAIIAIWMDGRPHPSEEALHTFAGFTTGVWEGNTLTTYTTHYKEGYLRRNGVPTSDRSTFTMHFTRHGDTLTVTALIKDPVYLTAPFVISRSWQLDPTADISQFPPPCVPEAELADLRGEGQVPHYQPGENPFVNDLINLYHIPLHAVMGGAATMYPEFRRTLKGTYSPPEKCTRYCCGWGPAVQPGEPRLNCISDGIGTLR